MEAALDTTLRVSGAQVLARLGDKVLLGYIVISAVANAEIASGNQDLSNRTEQTAANLQRTSSSMSDLNDASAERVKQCTALHW